MTNCDECYITWTPTSTHKIHGLNSDHSSQNYFDLVHLKEFLTLSLILQRENVHIWILLLKALQLMHLMCFLSLFVKI